jgi:hypothetical protein
MRPLPKYMSTSFCSLFGPLHATDVFVPPQQPLPTRMPLKANALGMRSRM